MFYERILNYTSKSEKNPINKMYLQEIKLKWNKFQKAVEKENVKNEELIRLLNSFSDSLKQKKYRFSPHTKRGFKKNSLIFNPDYLKDLITFFLKKTGILEKKGIIWGFYPFSINVGFDPQNIGDMENDPQFHCDASPKFVQLIQKVDIQCRTSGKRNFHKYTLNLPLIVFHVFKELNREDFVTAKFYASMGKETFSKSKHLIITETLAPKFIPFVQESSIDKVFIMRRSHTQKKEKPLNLDVINDLQKTIIDFLATKENKTQKSVQTGIIG